jgi:hypothetical protein
MALSHLLFILGHRFVDNSQLAHDFYMSLGQVALQYRFRRRIRADFYTQPVQERIFLMDNAGNLPLEDQGYHSQER